MKKVQKKPYGDMGFSFPIFGYIVHISINYVKVAELDSAINHLFAETEERREQLKKKIKNEKQDI